MGHSTPHFIVRPENLVNVIEVFEMSPQTDTAAQHGTITRIYMTPLQGKISVRNIAVLYEMNLVTDIIVRLGRTPWTDIGVPPEIDFKVHFGRGQHQRSYFRVVQALDYQRCHALLPAQGLLIYLGLLSPHLKGSVKFRTYR